MLPLTLKVALPPAEPAADSVKLEVLQQLASTIGDFDLYGDPRTADAILTVKVFASACRSGIARTADAVDSLLREGSFTVASPSAGTDLKVAISQSEPADMLLPLGCTLLVIHHMARLDCIAGVTDAMLRASGYGDGAFTVLAEMLGNGRLPARLQSRHGNTTVVKAIVRMTDLRHGKCPLVRDFHRGNGIGAITVDAHYSGDQDILIVPPPPPTAAPLCRRTAPGFHGRPAAPAAQRRRSLLPQRRRTRQQRRRPR